jgi:hypothetical protein
VSQVIEQIRSRGYWDIAIWPEPYQERRVDYGELRPLLTRLAVRMRGWPVPFIDDRADFLRENEWIGQDIDAAVVDHYEAWRFFTSGQFTQLRSVSADWREGREATAVPDGARAVIEVWEILYYLTEVFELAARLSLSPAGGERVTITATLHGVSERALVFGVPRYVPFMEPHRANTERIEQTKSFAQEELVGTARESAAAMAREFFLRFGWTADLDRLLAMQRELTES